MIEDQSGAPQKEGTTRSDEENDAEVLARHPGKRGTRLLDGRIFARYKPRKHKERLNTATVNSLSAKSVWRAAEKKNQEEQLIKELGGEGTGGRPVKRLKGRDRVETCEKKHITKLTKEIEASIKGQTELSRTRDDPRRFHQ